MLHLRVHLRFHFKEYTKRHKNVQKKMHFMLQLTIHLTVQSRGSPEGTFDCAPKDELSDLDKDARKGAYELALKGALEVDLHCTCGFTCWCNK